MPNKLESSEVSFNEVSFFVIPFAVLLIALLAMVTSYKFTNFASSKEEGEEALSSIHMKKNGQIFAGKHQKIVKVGIEQDKVAIPHNPIEPVALKGLVYISQASSSAHYKWILPDGVTPVSGDVEGALNANLVGQTQVVQITVTGFDQTEKKIITLSAEARVFDQNYGGTALISSRPEDSMEFIAPDMKTAVDEQAGL